jgi:LysM repeat protein
MADYIVKRGDSLWSIASAYKSKISGSTINAKIDTLVKVNKIKNRNLIYVGQGINFASSTSGSTSSTASRTNKPVITGFGLQASSANGRDVYVTWEHDWDNTKCYTYHWEQHLYGQWVSKGADENTSSAEHRFSFSEFTADEAATKVRFSVKPVSDTYEVKSGNTTVQKPYWTNGEWAYAMYDFSNNPPLAPDTPNAKLDELDPTKLLISYDSIDPDKLDAKYIRFNVVKNNTSSVYTSPNIAFTKVSGTDAAYTVSHPYIVEYGADYKVRACTVGSNGKTSGWSDFCGNVGTRPCAPKKINQHYRKKRSDGSISAYLEWNAVTNATHYIVEYTTLKEDFESGTESWLKVQTDGARTSIEIADIATGSDYFFRVKAVNANGESEPTDIVTIPIGEPPAAPTTWSSANSAFVGEAMELNWTHNTRDGSAQTWAQLSLKINDGEWTAFMFENTTNLTSGERMDVANFTYGKVISYKGELHVKMDTTHADLKNTKVQWKVRTAGVTDAFSDTDWSVDRIIYIYEKPSLELSVTSDLAGLTPFQDVTIPAEEDGGEAIVIRKALTSLPFYIRATVILESYEIQRPIGYHVRVVANDYYETVDNAGRSKTVNPGDAVYSKYFDTEEALIVEMSANNIDLEPLIRYTVYCDVDMSTGLAVSGNDEFNVYWADTEYTIRASIAIDEQTYTAAITPVCENLEGDIIENITMAVYRREYNGALTEIAANIPNNGTTVIDPHPALDYARYRLIAKDTQTGAISFYDMPGHRIGCGSVIIQWDEEWSQFDTTEEHSAEAPAWSGSMLVLPYNVKIADKRKRDVSRIAYAGREYPVSYHGTLIEEGSQWSMVIPKDDVDSIYALRRLSLWAGPVYIREPSGMGFWANVVPSFNIDYGALTIPITLDVTRVEGGV